jgi:hypothetical protein
MDLLKLQFDMMFHSHHPEKRRKKSNKVSEYCGEVMTFHPLAWSVQKAQKLHQTYLLRSLRCQVVPDPKDRSSPQQALTLAR